MRTRRLLLLPLVASALALSARHGGAVFAAEPTPAEKAVAEAESDLSKMGPAKAAVAAAIEAEPTAVGPRLLLARLLFAAGRAAKTAERASAFQAALAALDEAVLLDRWDPAPWDLRVDVLKEMGAPDQKAFAEALRARAIRRPGDSTAREAYKRQTGKVPQVLVGDPLPRINWKDSRGEMVSSESLWAKGPVVIELFRSAVWCPYCQKQILSMHDAADGFAAAEVSVVACSPDTPETIAGIEKDGLKGRKPFRLRLLSDTGGYAANHLGYLNPETIEPGVRPEAYGLPFPTTFIVDNRGVVRFVKSHGDARDRVKPEEMIAEAKRIRVEMTPKK